MKNILLTTTALVLTAGVASAEITITGSATAGLAREGLNGQGTKLVAAVPVAEGAVNATVITALDALTGNTTTTAASGTTSTEANNDTLRTELITDRAANVTARTADALTFSQIGGPTVAEQKTEADAITAHAAVLAKFDEMIIATRGTAGVDAVAATSAIAGDMDSYMEVSLTANASVETDGGLGISTAMSIDAGTGYDFADDDGFDDANLLNRKGSVGLDHVTISGGFGSLKMSKNNIAHLVDGDDDGAGDLQFSGAMGNTSYNFVADIQKDGKTTSAADMVDTAWSADVSTDLGGVALRVAMDEESGYAVSASMAVGGGMTVSVDSKKEAKAADATGTAGAANNGIDVSYSAGSMSFGADYDSVDDGDQYGYNVGYTTGNSMKITYKSDQDNDWTATVSMPLGGGITAAGGVNYTKDAYLGVSFSF